MRNLKIEKCRNGKLEFTEGEEMRHHPSQSPQGRKKVKSKSRGAQVVDPKRLLRQVDIKLEVKGRCREKEGSLGIRSGKTVQAIVSMAW
jgi:hypothetical protein